MSEMSQLNNDECIKIIEFFTICQSIVVTQKKFKIYYIMVETRKDASALNPLNKS